MPALDRDARDAGPEPGGARGRAGRSIAAQLVLVSSAVVVAVVAAAAWQSQSAIQQLAAAQIAARRTAGEAAIVRESELVVAAVANAVALPLSTGMDADVRPALEAAVRDHGAQWFAILEPGGAVHRTSRAPPPEALRAVEQLLAAGARRGELARAALPSSSGTDWVYSAPIRLGDSVQGALRMGVSTAALARELDAALAAASQRAREVRLRLVVTSIVVLAIGVLAAALYGLSLARPIRELTRQAERIARGELDRRLRSTRRDELGVLATAFDTMAGRLAGLLEEQAEKASLEKELSLARHVQQAMLPPEALDRHASLRVVGACLPASSCGGDWWTYRKLSGGRMLLVIGDATGHGLHSAMIAATARGAVEALAGIDERLLSPEQVLRAIDSAIRQVGDHDVQMTAFAAVVDSVAGALHYANAGHNFPYVVRLGPERILEDAAILALSSNPLGDRAVAAEIRRASRPLVPGDLLVAFTDGVVERSNRAGKLYGDRRLRAALTGQSLHDDDALARLRDSIVASVERYGEGQAAEDDITLVLCHYDPPPLRRALTSPGAGPATGARAGVEAV